jgi:hypothetical protein
MSESIQPDVNKCGSWAAWHDFMPGKPPTLYVTGQCTFPTPGYTVTLRRAVPQGINPAILLLEKVVTAPTGVVPQVVTTLDVRFEEQTNERYTEVTINPDGVTVTVEIVH